MSEVTALIELANRGDRAAANRLLPLVYEELKRIAIAKMARESAAHTLQPTALVHEAWLRLGGDEQAQWANRRHFFGAAANAMSRILIERARQRRAVRHGGGQERVTFDDACDDLAAASSDRLLGLTDALTALEEAAPEKAELVKLRFFTGLSIDEAAATLAISPAMAKRWWAYARVWLMREIERGEQTRPS